MDLKTDVQSIPELEAVHTWEAVLALGDNQGSLPRFYVEEWDGLNDLPDLDDLRVNASGMAREKVYPSLPRGKTITCTGKIQAQTAASLRFRAAFMRAALLPDPSTLREGTMRIVPKASYGGKSYRYTARVRSLQISGKQTYEAQALPSAYQRDFTLVLRMSDGRYFVDGETIVAQGANGSGANNPFVDVTNTGTAPADPVYRITGPVTNPQITRPGYTLRLPGLVIAGGGWVDVDFLNRRVVDSGGFDRTPYVDDQSNWWERGIPGLPPASPLGVGVTTRVTLAQTGSGNPGAGSNVRATFDAAVW